MAKARVVNVQFNDEQVFFGDYANHLLAEGDSWFAWAHLNLKPSSNILEQLQFTRKTVVVSYAFTGDVIRNMGDISRNPSIGFEMRAARYSALLLSGGGNDLIDALRGFDGGPGIIAPLPNGAADVPRSYINPVATTGVMDVIRAGFNNLFEERDKSQNRSTPIILHTYDYPTARDAPATFMGRPAVGPWLYSAFEAAQVPARHRDEITRDVYDELARTLLSLSSPTSGIHVVDTRGTLASASASDTGLSGDWINEIHPDAHGYALLAEKWNRTLASLNIS